MPRAKASAGNGRKPKYDTSAFAKMFKAGKDIRQIAKQTGASTAWVTYSLKQQGVKMPVRATAQAGLTASMRNISRADIISTISRSVAGKTLAGAKVVPPEMTREEMFDSISAGVEEGVKRIIGFGKP